jgi:hypothetical protein
LLYQEGRFQLKARTRVRELVLGVDGPDLVLGKAHTEGVIQTELSKKLQPPVKWSYLKLVGRFAIGSIVALIFDVQSVMSSSETVSSLAAAIFVLPASFLFFFLACLFWRHNRLVYSRKHAEWERSFLCGRCGKQSQHAVEFVCS